MHAVRPDSPIASLAMPTSPSDQLSDRSLGSQRAHLEASLAAGTDPRASSSASYATAVLVIGVDADMRGYVGRSVASMMRLQPCHIVEATDGTLALALAREHQVSLIVADADAPGVGGGWLAEAVAGDPKLCRTPVLLLSSDARLASASSRPGCAVLAKPFARRTLATTLRTLAPHL